MDAVSNSVVTNASTAKSGSVEGVAAISMLKKSLDLQASSAAQLIAALPQLPLATHGSVGTRVNTFA